MGRQIYLHGTNQDFAQFLRKPPNRATHGASNSSGIFLTTSKIVASQYADLAQGKFYPDNHDAIEQRITDLVAAADRAAKRRDFDRYEQLTDEVETLSTEMRDTEHGRRILSVEVEAGNPKVFSDVGCLDLYEMTELLSDAERNGHDAVIFDGIIDSVKDVPEGETYSHIVVFNPALCKIVDVEFMPASDGSLMPEDMAPIHRSMMRIVDPFEIGPEAEPERELELA